MDIPPPDVLLQRITALPAARPLMHRLNDTDTIHLVGGAVRDLLLGTDPTELDLVVEADAAELAAKLGGRIRSHDRFGTATVALDGHVYDIARSRRETYAHPGALPDVEPAPLTEDLRRRDFTVNAMAIALSGAAEGTLTTVPNALPDLDQKRLRVLHDRSFIDDPTRLLRMARYASRLGFAPEPHTAELARAALEQGALRTVSGARVGSELRLLAREPDPVAALGALAQNDLDRAIDPGLRLTDPALARNALALLPDDGRRDLLVIAVATIGLRPDDLRKLLDELAFEAGERDTIVAAATRAGRLAEALSMANAPSAIAEAARGKPPELVALAGALGPAEKATAWLTQLRHVRLEIDGRDLIAAGVPEGPEVGAGLDRALRAKLDSRANGRDAELAEALSAAR
jgi:tRNA nucleotidyltransferase (CCA-adding enzyme)